MLVERDTSTERTDDAIIDRYIDTEIEILGCQDIIKLARFREIDQTKTQIYVDMDLKTKSITKTQRKQSLDLYIKKEQHWLKKYETV